MKRILRGIILTAMAAMALTSCENTLTPEQQATLDVISRTSGEVRKVTFTSFAAIDSTTVAQELRRREALFKTKVKTHDKLESKYRRSNMPANMAKNLETKEQAEAILTGIHELQAKLESCRDSIIYRSYKFSCKGKFEDGRDFDSGEMYINITPDGQACNLRNDGKYNFGMGFTIPGYSELLEKNRMKEE